MKRLPILIIVLLMLAVACSPAAAPATQAPAAQAPAAPAATREVVVTKEVQPAPAAKPTGAPALPTQAPAQAIQPTVAPLSTSLPEFKAPQSGGVLNPPTLIPTVPGKSSVTSGQAQPQVWIDYRDKVTGLAFQHPRDWPLTVSRNNKGTVESISVASANSTDLEQRHDLDRCAEKARGFSAVAGPTTPDRPAAHRCESVGRRRSQLQELQRAPGEHSGRVPLCARAQ